MRCDAAAATTWFDYTSRPMSRPHSPISRSSAYLLLLQWRPSLRVITTALYMLCTEWTKKLNHFYSASALLAMQTAVRATADLSICLSVRLSVTFRCYIQTNEDTIGQSSAAGRTTILVSGEIGLTFIRIFARDHPSKGAKVRHSPAASENLTNNQP